MATVMPVMTRTGAQVYDHLSPLAYDDPTQGFALAIYCLALARMLDVVADLSGDTDDGRPGWSQLWDVDTIRPSFLRWLAQFPGVRLPDDLDDAASRQRIKETDGRNRGTVAALIAAAKPHLTGNQAIWVNERHGSAWRITVTTLTAETPDPAIVLAALREQKEAGLVLTHSVVTGGDFNTLRDTHADFADLAATFTTFDDMRDDPSRQ